jgi:hypothetical protein
MFLPLRGASFAFDQMRPQDPVLSVASLAEEHTPSRSPLGSKPLLFLLCELAFSDHKDGLFFFFEMFHVVATAIVVAVKARLGRLRKELPAVRMMKMIHVESAA